MAEKKTAEGAIAPSVATNGNDSDFVDIQTDRPIYKPAVNGKTPLRGFLVGYVDMPEGENGTWAAYVIRATRPCEAVDGFSDEPVAVRPGTEVLLPATAKMREIYKFAVHPELMVEVIITPIEKVKIGNGRSMWRYRIQAKKPVKRTGTDTIMALPPAPAHRALAQDNVFAASSEVAEATPF